MDDSIAARRAAWAKCRDEIEPQIRGLEDMVSDTLSEELRNQLRTRLAWLKQRHELIDDAEAAQDAADAAEGVLEAHGFPGVPDTVVPAALVDELDREGADEAAARGGFSAAAPAESVTLNLGQPRNIP